MVETGAAETTVAAGQPEAAAGITVAAMDRASFVGSWFGRC